MPAYVESDACEGCGERPEPECQRICPADIVRLAASTGKAEVFEPDACWECFACVKMCPRSAIQVRGAEDVLALGARAMPCRGIATIDWIVAFRNGATRRFQFPIRTTPLGSIAPFAGMPPADPGQLGDTVLCGERPIRLGCSTAAAVPEAHADAP